MWLALCDPSDAAGLWTVAGLRHLGLDPVEVLLPEELAAGTLVAHRIGPGGAGARLRLHDGRTIRGEDLRGVLNRLPDLPPGSRERLGARDREYVAEELAAMLSGLFASLRCPVLNPLEPWALGGSRRSEAEWRMLAARSGLPARDLRVASWDEPSPAGPACLRIGFVVGARVFGVPAELHPACMALAEAARTPLLELSFAVDPGGRWLFESAGTQPDLRHAGRPALAALAETLGRTP